MSYNTGDRVGDYQVVDVLGAGGMGKVYKVRNVISDRVEAMKVLLPNLESDPELGDRFMREIKVQASLDHPNIAGLHTALRLNNQLIMLLEFVEGRTIEAELRNGPIPVAKGVDYIKQALAALSYAHSHGVVHRDIKPANMMLSPSGVVKLMDFGIAKMTADRKLTQTGRTVGSLYYMSPEQINGAIDLDGRSDIYSIGISLYEIVTNRRPFQGDSDYSIMAAHLNMMPVPPIEVDPTLPPALNEIILMSIHKDPAQRFQTATAFRAALESVAVGFTPAADRIATVPMPPPVPPVQATSSSSKRGLYMAVGSVVTVAVLAVAALKGPEFFRASSAASPEEVETVAPQPVQPAPASTPAVTTPELAQPTPPAVQETRPIAQLRPQPTRPQPTQPAVVEPSATQPAPVASQTQVAAPVTSAPQQAAPAAVNAQVLAVNEQVLDEARERLMLLATRANSVRGSLASMRRQMGNLNLSSEFTTREQRMETYLDQAESALKSSENALQRLTAEVQMKKNDVASSGEAVLQSFARAKKNLDAAERAIEELEGKFGR